MADASGAADILGTGRASDLARHVGPRNSREIAALISSLGAMLRVTLRRALSDWPIVLAAGLIVTIASTLLAAGAMYASAVSVAGLHRALADAPVTEANVGVTVRLPPEAIEAADANVTDDLVAALGPVGGTVVRVGRSDSFTLPGPQAGDRGELAVLGYAEGLERAATLVSGAWPSDASAADPTVPVAVADTVASALALDVGDELELRARINESIGVRVSIEAIFAIDDRNAAQWWEDEQVLDGVVTSERFVTHGPLFTTRANLLGRAAVGQLSFGWRALPAFDRTDPEGIDGLRERVRSLRPALVAALTPTAGTAVETGLPELLDTIQRSLLVSRTGVLVLVVQLTVLAAYAVLLSAGLLLEHRRAGSALLRSRGAGRLRLAQMALIEGLVLAGVATLVAPWLGMAALEAFDAAGPLADVGLQVRAVVTPEAWLAAGAAAALCLVALVLPTLLSSESIAASHGSLSRAETRDIGRRLGLDAALVAIAGVGLVQLRTYGAPLTATVRGTIGLDPLLVATPAIGLAAGAVVALRLVPLVAVLIERGTARGRGLVGSLGARQLARRPLRYTRAALLLMLAVAMGVFSVSYTATWTGSQRDQANHEVGADLRVAPGRGQGSPPAWALADAYRAIPGVRALSPVVREPVSLGSAAGRAEILGVDAAAAEAVVRLRSDLADATVGELMAPLAAARPAVDLVQLPGERREMRALRLTVSAEVRELRHDDGSESDLAPLDGWRGLTASVVVRDATGALHRFVATGPGALFGSREGLEVPIPPDEGSAGADEGSAGAADGRAAAFSYPLDLVAVELAVSVPPGYVASDATIAVHAVDAAVLDAWQPVPLREESGWRARASYFREPQRSVDVRVQDGAIEATTGGSGLPALVPLDEAGRGTVVTFAPAALDGITAEPVPVLVTDAVLAATGREVGEELPVALGGVRRRLLPVSSVRGFPTTESGSAAIVMDLPTLALLRFESSGAVSTAEEWWLAAGETDREAITATLEGPRLRSASVTSRTERALALATDPVALGIIGALTIGFAAASLFAVVGFVVSTIVSARERLVEFALLGALGLSGGQLRAWLTLESAVLAAISLAAGTGLGLAMAWVALPFVQVTQGAVAPFPPVAVVVPWDAVAGLEVVGVAALAASVVLVTRLMRASRSASLLRAGEA